MRTLESSIDNLNCAAQDRDWEWSIPVLFVLQELQRLRLENERLKDMNLDDWCDGALKEQDAHNITHNRAQKTDNGRVLVQALRDKADSLENEIDWNEDNSE